MFNIYHWQICASNCLSRKKNKNKCTPKGMTAVATYFGISTVFTAFGIDKEMNYLFFEEEEKKTRRKITIRLGFKRLTVMLRKADKCLFFQR